VARAPTDATGAFSLEHVPAGVMAYVCVVAAQGHNTYLDGDGATALRVTRTGEEPIVFRLAARRRER
jgi:hypothetical protein